MPEASVAQQISALFRKTPVMQMRDIVRGVGPRSRRSLFRDLTALGYRSSYTHTGRYYTLVSVPEFDADGLWRYQGIGFSRDGTLTSTWTDGSGLPRQAGRRATDARRPASTPNPPIARHPTDF